MSDKEEAREMADEQLEGVAGGYIYPSLWAKFADMASEKKVQEWDRDQFRKYLRTWREETQMKGYTDENLDRDFESIVDYCYSDWKWF